jgi:hypothetical protein
MSPLQGKWQPLAVSLLLALVGPSAAQDVIHYPLPPTTNGGFSGQLQSQPLGFRGFQSQPYFPGSRIGMFARGFPITPNGSSLTNVAVSPSNLFAAYYGNPLAGPGGTFGAPLYNVTTATTATTGVTTQVRPAAGTVAPVGGVAARAVDAAVTEMPVAPLPAGNLNILRGQTTGVGTASAPAVSGPLRPRSDLQRVIDRSTALAAPDTIRVMSDGPTLVLQGSVVNEQDRRLAEALVRLSPGVGPIRNELVVKPALTKPASP